MNLFGQGAAFLLALTGLPLATPAQPVKIHEVLAGPAGYIDLHNTSGGTVRLDGWVIKACTGGPMPTDLAVVPAGSSIPPGGHYLVVGQYFAGSTGQDTVVESIDGDGQLLLDRKRALVDRVAWAPSSPCRERDAAQPCDGLPLTRDAASTDTDDNRVDFGCELEH
ncbi:Lamin Tail Domain [Amycolatopsis xylanica]|uniref:Lamin Tail Domain n=1 Tax=Amycolatopsis xylanica TaxID=589385 RepID=A0A1H3R5K3_9PSEU|nr:lamin tail domain-containing protein [Amycolatopsis xylanica]SDZ20595.1 Lamin Tail Domain [Amycolatopsis xylanica]